MKFLQFAVLSALFFLPRLLFSQTTEKWNLEKCIEYAVQHNLQVRQVAITSAIAKSQDLQSKLNLLPSIEGNASFNNNFGSGVNLQTYSFSQGNSQSLQMSLQGMLPVFTGLQQIFNIERTKYELLASKFDYEESKRNIALSVASAYLQELLNREILGVAKKQEQLTESQKTNVLSRIKSGALPEAAIYETESQLARDEANVVNAQNAVSLGLLALRQLLQIADSQFDIETPELKLENPEAISVTRQSVYDYALGNQPFVKSAEARVRSANAVRKISIGALSPTIAVFGNLSTGYFSQDRKILGYTNDTLPVIFDNGSRAYIPLPLSPFYGSRSFNEQLKNNFRKAVGISMNVPLFGKWQRITNIQNARLQMQIRELQLDASKNQLRQDIEQAYSNVTAAAQSYSANKKSLEAAQKSYEGFEKRFNAGTLGIFELQQSKNTLAIAESEMVKAKYTYVFRQKVLDFYQGKPIKLAD